MKLSKALILLDGASDSFCRVQRSVVVNLAHIVSRSEKEVKLDSGTMLPVSKSYTAELKKRLMEYVRLNTR